MSNADQNIDKNDNEKERKSYKVQIDKDHFDLDLPDPTGRYLLELAGKRPPENYALYLKGKGGATQRIELNDQVDLREPGVERFVTLPLDQTEGLGSCRREFDLPAEDLEWLNQSGYGYELVREGGVLRVVVYDYPVLAGYTAAKVDVNVRIDPGYPDSQIDMAYFFPALERSNGRSIAATCADSFDGRQWQRWSRHRTAVNPWRPGIDNLGTHFALIDNWLARELMKG